MSNRRATTANPVFRELIDYLGNLATEPTTSGELLDDLDAFVQARRPKKAAVKRPEPDDSFLPVPREPSALFVRERQWIEARLRRRQRQTESVRWSLGFDSIPYPSDGELAEAVWMALVEDSFPRAAPTSNRYPFVLRVIDAVRAINPRLEWRNPRWSNEEYRARASQAAIEGFLRECEAMDDEVGTKGPQAAKWILGGVQPEHCCLQMRRVQRLNNRDSIELVINPHVVTPEELRSVFRQLRASMIDQKYDLETFLHPLSIHRFPGTRVEQLARWNETFPLRRYRSSESLRVAAAKVTGPTRAEVSAWRAELKRRDEEWRLSDQETPVVEPLETHSS